MNSKNPLSLNEIAVKRITNYQERPTIIFLHDSLGCIKLWRDFPKKLGELTKCNVFIYDRQGYGKSCGFTNDERDTTYLENEAKILSELMEYYGLKKAILYGHSDGGSIALIAAAKYPEKVLGIITEGAHIFVEDETIKGIEEGIKLYETTDLKKKLKKYHGDKTENMFWAWAGTWTKDEFKDWNIENILPMIGCPSLIIQGEDDEYGTLKQVESIVNKTKGKSIKLIVPNAKHTPHKEVPEIILDETEKFINELLY